MSRRRPPPAPWEACGETREDYEAWEKREFRAALVASGIDPSLEGVPLIDAMEAAGLLCAGEAAMVRAVLAAQKDSTP